MLAVCEGVSDPLCVSLGDAPSVHDTVGVLDIDGRSEGVTVPLAMLLCIAAPVGDAVGVVADDEVPLGDLLALAPTVAVVDGVFGGESEAL